ncbi:MAG TPA: hypothetical protein VHU88_21015 [Sporichthyaceae bacterium]|jgi:hypothetical protein|nr:hypothetical protein [Sporichthyaceae bacterium]
MDTFNHFFTKTTTINARAEYALGFIVSVWLLLSHWSQVDFWQGVLLFAYIDLIGTVPALIAYHRSPTGRIAKSYYVVYDVLHSAVTQGLVIILYIQLFGWHWCLLAIPAHIFIDRAMFNNYPKPFGVAFEPVLHPAFERFVREYKQFDYKNADWKAMASKHKAGANDPVPADVHGR